MPVSGVIPDNAAPFPRPLSLPAAAGLKRNGSMSSTFGSISSLSSRSVSATTTTTTTTTGAQGTGTPIRIASTSKIYTHTANSNASSSSTGAAGGSSASHPVSRTPSMSRGTKPPTPITPTDSSHVFGKQPAPSAAGGSSSASASASSVSATASHAHAHAHPQPSSADYGKARTASVRDAGTSSSAARASPRPKYPTSMSRDGTPNSKPSVHLGVNSPSGIKPLKLAAASSSKASSLSYLNGHSSTSKSGTSATAAAVSAARTARASASTTSHASRSARKMESGPSDADGETDQSTYITPPSSPEIAMTPTAATSTAPGPPNGRTVVPAKKDKPSDGGSAKPSSKPSTKANAGSSSKADSGNSGGSGSTGGSGSSGRASSDPTPTSTTASSSVSTSMTTAASTSDAPTPPVTDDGETMLVAMLRGRTETEILRAFVMDDKSIQTLKGIVHGGKPALLRGLSDAELDTLKRAIALFDFYWFTRQLDVDHLTAFVNKVTYAEIREIAEDEEYDTEADDEGSPVVVKYDGEVVQNSNDSNSMPPPPLPLPLPQLVPPPVVVDGDESSDECPTPPNETRVDPRTAYFDHETRHLRRVGRRCASGAALLAAAKRALRDQGERDDE